MRRVLKNYILIGLFSILIGFGVILSIRCSKLEKENIKLKLENVTTIDSIKRENEILEKDIKTLSEQIIEYEYKLDSLKKLKQSVIIKYKYVISENLTEGVVILKDNLRCEKYY